MYYPAILIEDAIMGGVIVILPDMPGLVTTGDTMDIALDNVQDAVEHYLRDAETAPHPSDLDEVKQNEAFQKYNGVPALVHVDLGFLEERKR
ncbi:type II toxin-antitoxin system HicB family antitoxin [Desulfovibrio inopinatus]|uniref:type II toxin-antitoxin system HicB family antitoxin n=1 Tax=Desulfovibrio inopinatus TaxID=102109 RepID=UPI00041B8C1E|nr:type II toxin-antitoxin system HicB family antitoxin [Desulfovibrio inopinatus]